MKPVNICPANALKKFMNANQRNDLDFHVSLTDARKNNGSEVFFVIAALAGSIALKAVVQIINDATPTKKNLSDAISALTLHTVDRPSLVATKRGHFLIYWLVSLTIVSLPS